MSNNISVLQRRQIQKLKLKNCLFLRSNYYEATRRELTRICAKISPELACAKQTFSNEWRWL